MIVAEVFTMKFFEEIKGEAIITALSDKKGIPRAEIEIEIQKAIDEAWSSHALESHELQIKLFHGQKPSPALFISRLAKHAKKCPRL
jgi:hypothetical protein